MLRTVMWLAVTACAVGAPVAHADDTDLERLQEEYGEARSAYFQKAKETGEYDRASHPAIEFLPKFSKYIKEHKGDSDAVPALVWVLRNGRSAITDADESKEIMSWAVAWIDKHHAADPEIAGAISAMRSLAYLVGEEPLNDLYDKIIAKNPADAAKAAATFNRAFTLYRSRDDDKEAARKRAISLFRKITKDYPNESVTKRARGYIFEIENLQIGMKAPEIVGTNVDNEEIRLSQFYGQVVVIDFWGFW